MNFYRYIILIATLSFITLNAQTLRVEVAELNNNISKYKVLDTREKEEYLNAHIKTALNFPVDLTYEHQKIDGKIRQPSKIQSIVRELGLNVDDHIVIYDEGTFFNASRLFWTLEVYGFKNVKLLNGGMKQWKQSNFKTTKALPKIVKSNYIASVNHNRLATKFSTQIATRNPNQVILDARGIKAYKGEVSSAARYGHIPKATYFPAVRNINYDDKILKLKTTKNLKNLYSKIDKKSKIIVYCAMGKIATTNYFALRELGYNVANYDASWKEWGNDFNLPVINLSKK